MIGKRMLVSMIGLMTALAHPLRADLPEVMDRVPADARVMVVIPSVNALDEASAQLLVAMEQPEASTLKQVLRVLGVAGAIDPKRPAAAFWSPGGGEGAAPVLAMLVPTHDAARALESVKAKKVGAAGGAGGAGGTGAAEVWSFDAGGRTWFMRAAGATEMLVGIDPASVRNFQVVTGQMEAHRRAMGAEGVKVGQGAHLFAVGEVEEFRPFIEKWLVKARGATAGLAAPAAQIPGGPAFIEFVGALSDALVRDGERCVIGARFDGNGAVLDVVTLFAPGSEMDTVSRADRAEKPPAMFASLPAQPFLAAAAIDASHEGLRDLAASAMSSDDTRPRTALDTASGIELAIYEPAGPIVVQGALSKSLLHWRSEEPAAMGRWFRSYLQSLDGSGGVTVSYDAAAGEYSGVGVDRWAMLLPTGGGQQTQLMYGQSGSPRGVVAVREKDGYISAAPDELVSNLLAGRAAGMLSSNAMVRDLSARLPGRPVAACFVNVRPVLMQVMPLLAMMGINIDVPLRMAPIAGAVAMEAGSAHVGVFVPSHAIKLGWQMWSATRTPPAPQPAPAGGRG